MEGQSNVLFQPAIYQNMDEAMEDSQSVSTVAHGQMVTNYDRNVDPKLLKA